MLNFQQEKVAFYSLDETPFQFQITANIQAVSYRLQLKQQQQQTNKQINKYIILLAILYLLTRNEPRLSADIGTYVPTGGTLRLNCPVMPTKIITTI